MKRFLSAFLVLAAILTAGPIVRAIGNSLSDRSAVPSAPQKAIATGDLWLHLMRENGYESKGSKKMDKVSDGIYSVDFSTDELTLTTGII